MGIDFQNLSSAEGIVRMLTASWVSRALYAAAKLDLAGGIEALGGVAVPVELLAERVGCHPSALRRLLRALASVGVFQTQGEPAGWCYSLTPLAEHLLSDTPGSLRHVALMYGEEMAQSWHELPAVLRDEEPAWERVLGSNHFDYYQGHSEAAAVFDQAMKELGRVFYRDDALVESYDFDGILGPSATVVDVGGGLGGLLSALLERCPSLHGILYDRPHVVQRAKQHHEGLPGASYLDRLRFESGDFFEAVPSGADAYLLKRVLHDWDDERCVSILHNIRGRMSPRARVLIAETVIPSNDANHFSKWLDLNMMVVTGGRERTEQEFAAILAQGGLRLIAAHHSGTLLHILEGVSTESS